MGEAIDVHLRGRGDDVNDIERALPTTRQPGTPVRA
jgi:hypothetical protein